MSRAMPESEALWRWCPFTRQMPDGVGASYNRIGDDGPVNGTLCFGSDCMMWRWAERSSADADPVGYCGLAGVP